MSQSFSFPAQNGPLLLIRDAIDFSLIDGNTIIIFITDAIEDWISHTSVYVFESTQIQGEFLSKYIRGYFVEFKKKWEKELSYESEMWRKNAY